MRKDEHRTIEEVQARYGEIAREKGSCCGGSCCGVPASGDHEVSVMMGYTCDDLSKVPEGANMGLGCGNPQVTAELKPGEVVLDLGCGGGLDCFLAAGMVGPEGKVIGVDMTPEMISLARDNAGKSSFSNIEFRLGEIEHLPVADSSVDVIISNCVINLSPAKEQVFLEAYRVLKPGGRLAVSDTVAVERIPDDVQGNGDAYCGCVGGAASPEEIEKMLREAGFSRIAIEPGEGSAEMIRDWFPGSGMERYVRSAMIVAVKEEGTGDEN